jgi:hypothetical protein
VRQLVTANVAPSSQVVTLMIEEHGTSETSVLARAARRSIPEDGILHATILYIRVVYKARTLPAFHALMYILVHKI